MQSTYRQSPCYLIRKTTPRVLLTFSRSTKSNLKSLILFFFFPCIAQKYRACKMLYMLNEYYWRSSYSGLKLHTSYDWWATVPTCIMISFWYDVLCVFQSEELGMTNNWTRSAFNLVVACFEEKNNLVEEQLCWIHSVSKGEYKSLHTGFECFLVKNPTLLI